MKKKRASLIQILMAMTLLLIIGVFPIISAFAVDQEQASEKAGRITKILAGDSFSLGLRANGTVAFAGDLPESSKMALSSWKGISELELYGWSYIVGYSETDPIVLTTTVDLSKYGYGTNSVDWSKENLCEWTDVISVVITPNYIAGLKKNGTVLTKTGGQTDRIDIENFDVTDWQNITAIYNYNDSCLIGLKKNGTVLATDNHWLNYYWNNGKNQDDDSDWNHIVRIDSNYLGLFAFREDGTILGASYIDGSAWSEKPKGGYWDNLSEIICGSDSVFALRKDGGVMASGDSTDPRLAEVRTWKGITQLSMTGKMRYLPVGLCSDGTVRVVDSYMGEKYGSWDVSDWRKVDRLFTGSEYTLGLRKDGTVLVTGGEYGTLEGIHDAEAWTDIVDIAQSDRHVLGLRKDGTVVALGDNDASQCDVAAWTSSKPTSSSNLKAVDSSRYTDVALAEDFEVYALCENGTVAMANVGRSVWKTVETWTDIVQIVSNDDAVFGLHRDGTVSCCLRQGSMSLKEHYYQNILSWNDIRRLVTEHSHIFGLKNDGTVVWAGPEWYGSARTFDISTWKNVKELYAVTGMESYLCGLCGDGTLLKLNWEFDWNGRPEHITSVACGKYVWLGLKEGGTVICSGIDSNQIEDEIGQWHDIVQVAAGASKAAGLHRDGTVVTAGFALEKPEEWTNVMNIQMDENENLFSTLNDGTVRHFCSEEDENPVNTEMVESWTDIVKVVTGPAGQIVGLRKDGALVGIEASEFQAPESMKKEILFSEYGKFNDPSDEEQLRQRATWYFETYIASPEKLSVGKKHFSVEGIMDAMRMMNGEFQRSGNGRATYNDTDLISIANVLHSIGNYDSFVQYGNQIFFTPTAPLFADGTLAQEAALIIDKKMEKVVNTIRASDDDGFLQAAREWGSVVVEMFCFPDLTGEIPSVYQVNAPESFFLYHSMSSKYASTILEYSELHHLTVMVPYGIDDKTGKQIEEPLSIIMYNLNERASDALAESTGNQSEYEQNNRSLPENLFVLAKEYFNCKYLLEQNE